MTTAQLIKACEDGSFCHDMAIEIAQERDASVRALREAIRAQGEQFKLRYAAESEAATLRALCLRTKQVVDTMKETLSLPDAGYTDLAKELLNLRIEIMAALTGQAVEEKRDE